MQASKISDNHDAATCQCQMLIVWKREKIAVYARIRTHTFVITEHRVYGCASKRVHQIFQQYLIFFKTIFQLLDYFCSTNCRHPVPDGLKEIIKLLLSTFSLTNSAVNQPRQRQSFLWKIGNVRNQTQANWILKQPRYPVRFVHPPPRLSHYLSNF